MTTEQHFNCIFCKDTFDNKEELQIHFRKHGDPKFKQNAKLSRPLIETLKNEKPLEENELVGCDVCEEVFPTISKAITHKHKVHPDHDTKYFCPFCGKLFTMKHLYNKHMQTNHCTETMVDKSDFNCDCCDVMFCGPSAMLYHNKFFHRQDTELPAIGQSRKVKHYVEHLINIYYCAFCGEEYNNKVNLHKHMGDDHGDENQRPGEVLKCPLCDAVFYHLDAYELHLMFHSSEDMYSEITEMASEVTEFSLETVPPIMEKVEEEHVPEESTGGIGDFLQLVMGDSVGSEDLSKMKSKKHKKRKKSKKSAITLDEFLNMNKDVFGDGLDVQGIEEVPTQVVLKKFKSKRPINVKAKGINADLNKLKKQGITVKSKLGNNPTTVKTHKIIPSKDTTVSHDEDKISNTITAPDDVLSKLMRQGNSQIKIVKKIIPQNDNKEAIPLPDIDSIELSKSDLNSQALTNDTTTNECENNDITTTKQTLDGFDKDNDNAQNLFDSEQIPQDSGESSKTKDESNNSHLYAMVNSKITSSFKNSNSTVSITKDNENTSNSEVKSKEISIRALNNCNPKSPSHNLNSFTNRGSSSGNDEDDFNESNENEKDMENDSGKSAISALKHLSHLITIKPVRHNKIQSQIDEDMADKPSIDNTEVFTSQNEKTLDNTFKAPEIIPKKIDSHQVTKLPSKSYETLKNVSQQVTVKSVAANYPVGSVQPDCKSKNASVSEDNESVEKPNPQTKSNNSDIFRLSGNNDENKNVLQEEKKDEVLLKQQTNTDILSRLKNVTTKAIPNKIKPNPTITSTPAVRTNINHPIHTSVKKGVIDENIEIFSIDDSDSEEAGDEYMDPKTNSTVENTQTTSIVNNALNNLGKHITVKSCQPKTNVNETNIKQSNEEKQTVVNKEYTKVKMHSSEIQKSINLQNTLKNLGSNITIKSKSSASAIKNEEEYKDFDDINAHNDQYDSDSESNEGQTVKITEITENTSDIDYDSNDDYDDNVLVQSPEEHNFEGECNTYDDEEEYTDIESQIQANTLTKISQYPNSPGLQNLKNCNSEITIKPVNEKNYKHEDIPSPSFRKEVCNKPKVSNNVISNKTVNQTLQSQNTTVNQKSSSAVNTSNTVKTVKKFQTQTVIQEITTVTKTIRTVNESTQEVQNSSQETVKPQMILNRNQPGNEHHGKVVRHVSPTIGTKVRSTGNVRLTNSPQIRPANQIVAIRAATTPIRLPTPATQIAKKTVPPQRNIIGKLKISPHLYNKNIKRPSDMSSSSCKKFKETTSASSETTALRGYGDSEPYSMASTSQSNFSSTTQVIKGNASVVTSQTRSEVNTNTQQQLSRLSGMCGLKIMKTSTKQAHVEEKSEISAPQRNTMEALEKLQRHGLLVKKPRIDYEETEHNTSFSESDDETYEQ